MLPWSYPYSGSSWNSILKSNQVTPHSYSYSAFLTVNPITSQHLHNDVQHHAVSSQCNSTYPQHCSSLSSTYNDDEGDEHPTLSHADPLPVTKETERTTTETLIDQTTSCDVDPLSITTCCNETVGQSSSHVNPVIIDEQKTATIACGNERSTVDNASIIPACSNNISKPSHSSHVVETTQITSDVEKVDQPTSEPLITTKRRVVSVDWLMSGNKSVCKQITQSIKNYTKQKATERSRIVESSREPSNVYKSDRLSKTNKQQNYTPLQDSTSRQKSLSVYDYATPASDRKRWQPFTQPVDVGIKKLKVSIHNMFTLVCILNFSIELCTVAMCKDLLSYCISRICTWKSVVHLSTVSMY